MLYSSSQCCRRQQEGAILVLLVLALVLVLGLVLVLLLMVLLVRLLVLLLVLVLCLMVVVVLAALVLLLRAQVPAPVLLLALVLVSSLMVVVPLVVVGPGLQHQAAGTGPSCQAAGLLLLVGVTIMALGPTVTSRQSSHPVRCCRSLWVGGYALLPLLVLLVLQHSLLLLLPWLLVVQVVLVASQGWRCR